MQRESVPMLSLRRRASRTAWIAIVAILVHAFMPLAHAAMQVRGDASSICTTGEPRVERIAFDGAQPEAPAVHLARQCPLCLAGAHFALVSLQPAFAAEVPAAHVYVARLSALVAPIVPTPHFSARAPPQV